MNNLKIMVKISFFSILFLMIFFSGRIYEQNKNHREVLVIYANVIGSQVVEINYIFDMVQNAVRSDDLKKIYSIRKNINKNLFSDMACSFWVSEIKNVKKEDFNDFIKGLNYASNYLSDNEKSKSECYQKMKAMKLIYEINEKKEKEPEKGESKGS